MIIRHTDDYTPISFGKLSDPGVLKKSPLYLDKQNINYYSSSNFQYIVDNIADMFGYKHGTISATVKADDYEVLSQNTRASDYLEFRFTMNAEINTYLRTSYYGKHFMYYAAKELGYPVVFGIVAHEVGHLVTHNALNLMNTKIVNGRPALFVTCSVHPYWDELCSDYLAGITLSKAVPRISVEPLCTFLADSKGGDSHPDGFWRTIAAQMGYQWGMNNSHLLTDRILSAAEMQKQLLLSFQENYYNRVYLKTGTAKRIGKTVLPSRLFEATNVFLGYL